MQPLARRIEEAAAVEGSGSCALAAEGHPCTAGGADEAGIATQSGVLDADLVSESGESHRPDVVANVLEEGRTGGDHPSAEEHDVRIDRVHQANRAHCQVAGGLAHQAAGQGVASDGCLVDCPTGELVGRDLPQEAGGWVMVECLDGPLHQGGGRGIALEVPVAAARALTGVLHLDDDVAALATVAVPALDDPALVDDSAADSRAQREEYEAAGVPPRAGPVFAVGRGVGVVLKDRLLLQLLRQADRGSAVDSIPAGWAVREASRSRGPLCPASRARPR